MTSFIAHLGGRSTGQHFSAVFLHALGQKQPLTSDSYRPFTTGEDVYEVKVDQPPLILKRFSMRVDTSTYARKAFQALNHTCWLAITHSSC